MPVSIADLPPPPVSVGPDSNGMMMTAEEYDGLSEWDDRYRYELINGVLIVSPFAGPAERDANGELDFLLRSYQRTPESALSRTLYEHEIRCGDNRRRADRAIWLRRDREIDPVHDVPEIVIELVAASRRDRHRDSVEKRKEYAAAGVQEYWVFDRFRNELTVFRGDQATVVPGDSVYTTPLLPGFELPLAEVFRVANRSDGG